MKKIVIDVLPDGTTTIHAVGFAGNSCNLATRELELLLAGDGAVDKKPSPDFFNQITPTQTNTRG